jgi:hypothetical protein
MIRGFRDLRTSVEILSSSRVPKTLIANFKSVLPRRLLSAFKKTKSFLQKADNVVDQVNAVGRGVVSNAIGTVVTTASAVGLESQASALASRKIAEAGRLVMRGPEIRRLAAISRSANEAMTTASSKILNSRVAGNILTLSAGIGLGVRIVEELNPAKLRQPRVDASGSSANAMSTGLPLRQTVARGLAMTRMVAPLARGVGALYQAFKTVNKITQSPRYYDRSRAIAGTLGEDVSQSGITPTPVVSLQLYGQQGLLADQVFYRLVLLAENIYRPLQERTGNQLRILEGYRTEHTGTSAHERGEAIDVTVGDGSLAQSSALRDLAQWASERLMFDEIVLCHSPIPTPAGQAWLHISFSPTDRRRQVWTKTFDDQFIEGLQSYEAYTPDSPVYAQDKAVLDENIRLAYAYLDRVAARDQKLNPVGVNTSESTSVIPTGESEGCTTLVSPQGIPYDPDQSPVTKDAVEQAFNAAVEKYPLLWEDIKLPGDRRTKTAFLRAVVEELNHPKVGVVGVRGNANDPSIDAIAILNPTAGPQGRGDDRWDDDKRLMVVDIILSSQSDDARWGWVDHTCLDDTSINPVFIPVVNP